MKNFKLLAAAAVIALVSVAATAEAKNFPSQNDNAQTFSRKYNVEPPRMMEQKKHHHKKHHHHYMKKAASTPAKQEKAAQIH